MARVELPEGVTVAWVEIRGGCPGWNCQEIRKISIKYLQKLLRDV